MTNFNFLSKLASWMEGLSSRIRPVSVSYPGSQSFVPLTERQPRDDREMTERRVRSLVASRGTKVTHMAFMLLFLLGSLNVLGADVTYKLTINADDFNTTSYAANNNEKTSNAVCTTDNTKTYEVKWTSNQVMKSGSNMQWQKSKGDIYNSTDLGTISSVEVTSTAGSFTKYYGTTEHPTSGTTVGNGFFTVKVGGETGTTSEVVVTFVISEGGGSSEPSISVQPVGATYAKDATPEALSVTAAAGNGGALSYQWYSNTTSSTTGASSISGATNASYTPSTAALGTKYYYCVVLEAGVATTVTSDIVAVVINEPSGTFAPFSGDIAEGDYLIIADGAGMNTTVSGNRLQYEELTKTGGNYVNPSTSLIWHIAASATDGYWTIYNDEESKYAAATTSNNQAQMLESGTDNKSLWSITHSGANYTITNKSNSRYLKKNGTYGFACYADGTVTLYKKALPTHAVTFTAAPTGGTVAVSAGSAINSGAQVEEGATVTITPTPSTYYRIASVTKGGQAVTPVQGVYSFTMPASDVAIVVTFELIPVTSVTLNKSALELVEGATETLSVTSVLPNTALNTVTWSSSNTDVATVTDEGVVTAVAAGTATITATSVATNTVKRTCAVTVSAPTGKAVTIDESDYGNVTGNVSLLDILSGVEVVLTAHPNAGYSVDEWQIDGLPSDPVISNDMLTCTFTMPDNAVSVNVAYVHEVASLKLHDAAGVTTYDAGNIHYWKESVTLPSAAATCSKVFMGWSADENRATAPEIAKGASYTIPNKGTNNDLYAVYATISGGGTSTTNIAYTNTETTTNMAAETNEAAKFNLDADEWSVIGASGSASNNVGLNKAQEIRLYGHASGGNTLTITAPQTVTSIALTMTANKDNVRVKVGGQIVTISDGVYPIGATTFVIENANTDKTQVVITNIAVNFTSDPIYSDYSTTCLPKSTTPVLTDGGTFTAATSVEILAEDGATIYYTTDGSDPKTSGTKQTYSTEIELSERGTYTIKAYAVEAGKEASDVASETYNINLPFTVAEAIAIIPNNYDERANTYIDGIVCTAGTSVSSGAMTYYISDNGSADGAKIRIYSGKGLNNEYFSATTDLKVGDKVRVFGKLNNYNGSYDVDNSYLTSLQEASVSSVAISGDATKTTYSAEDNSFSFAGLTATATYTTGYVKDVTAEATWTANGENPYEVTAAGNVNVTATLGDVTSEPKVVAVTFTTKTVASISLSYDAITTYVGHDFLKPTVTASYVEDIDDEDVTELATFDEDAYNGAVAGSYPIAVSYKGQDASYTITVKAIENNQATAYTAAEINDIIANSYKSTSESDYDVYVKGIVVENAYTTSGKSVYHISADGTSANQFYIYGAKYFDTETSATGNVKAGDDVIVKGKIQYFNSATPELKSSTVVYQLREGALTVNNVAEFEVDQPDLAEADLTINRNGSTGAITFSCEANDALEIVDNKLHAKGNATADVTVTATMEADNTEGKINFTGASTTFTVHVIPAKVRYAVTFDLDGGSADPEMSLGGQLENANVVIPDGTFTKDGYKFNGWVVKETESGDAVAVSEDEGVYSFTMPAAAVTVTAQWLEGSDFTWDASEKGYGNAENVTIATGENDAISIVFAKAAGSNDPKYYTSGTAVRTYAGNTVTIATKNDTKLINKITFTYGDKNVVADGLSEDKLTWTGLAKEVVLTTSGGQAHYKTINVTYINGTVTTLDIKNVSLMLTAGTKDLSISCNVTPTPAISYEIAEADQAIATVADGVVTAHSIGGPINVTARIAQGENYTAAVANFTITVTDKTPTQMSFPQASYDANLGSDFVEPTLTTVPEGISVAYSSSVETVATVDPSTGEIGLVGEGTTVITATFAGNDDYAGNTATYTLNVIDPNKDVLTADAIEAGSSYAVWNNKTFGSSVTYAGNSMTASGANAGAIQMRNTNPSGIVTTSAIGYLKSISAAETTNGNNSLEIYAKGSAYESSADLYSSDEAVKGVKIGTIGKDGGAMVFVDGKAYSDNYKYIGIKPVGGAVYYDDITITWTPAEFASFAVTYKAGEATGDDVVESIEEGSNISLKAANTFEAPEGKIFAGWLLEGEEDVREAGSKYTVTAAATFTAQWISVYTITYKPGEAEGENVTIIDVPAGDYELAENTFVAPANKEFAGWKLNNEGESLAAGANYNVTGNAVFTAQWSIIKQAADLAYTTTSYIITRGQSFEAPVLTNPHSLAVTYSGNNDEVATVNATTGAITLQGGIGEVTVTATFEANDYYYASEASYTLKVKDASLAGGWVRLTSSNNLMDGMKVIIAEYVSSGTDINAMGAQKTNNRGEVAGKLSEGKLVADEGTEILTLVAVGNNFALKTADNKYLYAASSSANNMKEQAKIDGNATWTISLSADGEATITAQGEYTRNVMRYNSSSNLFSCYASGQQDIAIYSKTVSVNSGTTNASDLEEYADVIVKEEARLTIDEEKPLGDITVSNGGTVVVDYALMANNITVKENATVTVNEPTEANNITVENGATIEVGATTAANNLVIQTTSGSTVNPGKSGQLTGDVTQVVSGDLFIEIKLCEGAMDAEASRKWYCISAPFNVNMNGGFFWGDGTQMVLNTDFQLFEWDGDRRATGISGWKRVSGVMKAGIAYFIGFDDERSNQNIIKLKATNKTISNKSLINAPTHSSSVDDKYANWNGLANPNFRHIALDKDVQAFDHNIQAYTTYGTGDYNFVVGTPFFIKETGDITIEAADNSAFRAPKREAEQLSYCVRIVREGKAGFDNQMYVRASEEASTSYEEGHDLVTMNAETSNYGALLWTVNYGGKRLAIEEAPLVNDKASYALSLYAPADGAYRIETPTVREDASLYLTYEGNIIWDLSAGAYELELNKGATEGYGLMLVRKAPQVTTGVENVQGDKTQCTKVILNDHVYILRDAQLYDVTGKAVK